MKTILLLVLLTASSVSWAEDWLVEPSLSQIAVTSIKQNSIGENHHFKKFTGSIDKNGKVSLVISLASLETNIPIRNTRLNDFFFEIAQYPHATFTAQVADKQIPKQPGTQVSLDISGELDLHGKKQTIPLALTVLRVDTKKILVLSRQPSLINVASFSLQEGLNKLREIAKLESITATVPVTFSVTLNKN